MLSPMSKSAAVAVDDLAVILTALLRADGHLCNVLTHIASGDWRAIEQAIVAILTPRNPSKKLCNLARNILELVCDDRGITGPIMRPFFFNAVARIAGKPERKRLETRVRRLRKGISLGAQVRSARPRRAKKSTDVRLGRQAHFNPLAAILREFDGATP